MPVADGHRQGAQVGEHPVAVGLLGAHRLDQEHEGGDRIELGDDVVPAAVEKCLGGEGRVHPVPDAVAGGVEVRRRVEEELAGLLHLGLGLGVPGDEEVGRGTHHRVGEVLGQLRTRAGGVAGGVEVGEPPAHRTVPPVVEDPP